MNELKQGRGHLKIYFQWPLFLSVIIMALNVVLGMMDVRSGLIMLAFTIVYLAVALWLYFYYHKKILKDMVEFSADYAWIQKQLLSDMTIPYAMADEKGQLLWMNRRFLEVVGGENGVHVKNLTIMFPEITKQMLEDEAELPEIHSEYKERRYRIQIKNVSVQGSTVLEETIGKDYEHCLLAVYLFDETELLTYRQEITDQKMVAGLIYLDNYDEALESVEEVRRSLLTALIDRKINKYISSYEGIVKKLEKDKYFFTIKQKYISELKESRFSLLEDVKTVNIGNEMAVTLSIGIGLGGETYSQNYEYARMSIDMALGRGGDQAVVKEGEKIEYYGGKSQQPEKATRVKARVKAHALRELMETKDRLIIMGHHLPDIDSFGAAIGIYRIATTMNKKASIVVNEVTSAVRPMMDRFLGTSDYPEDLILTGSEAAQVADSNTMLVVVDVNRPSICDAPELLDLVKTVVVLDHHRQSSEIIENAVLSYVEPYASSACEMVAEVLQYIADGIRIKPAEADAMYAGIVIDTNNFTNQAGVRTFEAAAFLRRNGADVTRVRKLFRDNMQDSRAKAEAISRAEIYEGAFAISECDFKDLKSPTIVAAQVANELMDIAGIKASVVLSEYDNKIYISARSIDEVNVQVMMEHLGGGGHRNIAGAQLSGVTMEEAKNQLKEVIKDMIEKGDIS